MGCTAAVVGYMSASAVRCMSAASALAVRCTASAVAALPVRCTASAVAVLKQAPAMAKLAQ